mmetsp:Transcript_17411/g.28909  ORF Transcript_17411/g.28909 Transcript_17411/m.28909 type:complete len:127 (-) Transcript_17411:914-1294(-)
MEAAEKEEQAAMKAARSPTDVEMKSTMPTPRKRRSKQIKLGTPFKSSIKMDTDTDDSDEEDVSLVGSEFVGEEEESEDGMSEWDSESDDDDGSFYDDEDTPEYVFDVQFHHIVVSYLTIHLFFAQI